MAAMNDGYLRHYKDALFYDLEVLVGDKVYNLHQMIVGNASSVLARAVENMKYPVSKRDSSEIDVELSGKETILPKSVILKMEKCGGSPWRGKLRCEIVADLYSSYWPDLIEYMYTGHVKVLSTTNIVGWLCIATDLELTTLKNELIDWIVSNISKADLFLLLPLIIAEPRANQFLRYAISIIAKNFSDYVEADRFTRESKSSQPNSSPPSKTKNGKTSNKTLKTTTLNQVPNPTMNTSETEGKLFFFDWRIFPFQAMKDLLHDKNLFAASEQDVFDAIMHYLEKYDESEVDAKEIASLFESVRFERLDYSTLEAALAHPLVPKELLSRALMARLAGFEKPSLAAQSTPSAPPSSINMSNLPSAPLSTTSLQGSRGSQLIQSPQALSTATISEPSPPHSRESAGLISSSSSQLFVPPAMAMSSAPSSANMAAWTSNSPVSSVSGPARDRRRQSYGRLFQWSSDFDTKGVLYYLGTREYRNEWQNPYSQKLVDVTWSSLEKGKASAIFEREPSECWTQDVPSSWFTVDLGVGRSLRITAYTLRHGGGTKQDLIRNWTLKGSVDGKEFATLMRHKDDESLSTSFAAMTWTITGATQAYRFFKVIQTGHNSSKHNFLSIGGVEFYGELIYDMIPISRFGGPVSPLALPSSSAT
jgi:hypothetical protein